MDKRDKYRHVFANTPVKVLKERTRNVLAQLDDQRFATMRNGYTRDWKGLKDLTNWDDNNVFPVYETHTAALLKQWQTDPSNTIEKLLDILEQLGRYDIIDDAIDFMYDDVSSQKMRIFIPDPNTPLQDAEISTSASSLNSIPYKSSFTDEATAMGDTEYERHIYDSYVCYEKDDEGFVELMVENLEAKYDLRLCIPDRDLVVHALIDHSATINFIRNRCKSMVIVLSESFVRSTQNSFLTMLAQAISVDVQSRLIIPVIYKTCILPTTLQALSKLDYTRGDKFSCFWKRLAYSIQQSSGTETSQFNLSSMLSSSSSTSSTPPSPMQIGNRSPMLLHPSSSSGYSSYSINSQTRMDSSPELEHPDATITNIDGIILPTSNAISPNLQSNTSGLGMTISQTVSPAPSRRSPFRIPFRNLRKRNKKGNPPNT